ncbi:MAG: GIY-YIG nuclease family protein [Mucilaginibacter polytrichastri]|nr:GIY-YIG nuclease family protein [Mucilaginibacter polytrichastri]
MLYALVDIETTGGHASAHGITEVAICIHDGTRVTERYETLINPYQTIPLFIQSMTGITQDMVDEAPDFRKVAAEIFALLSDKIFVAHNVNFDYSFLKHHLSVCGFELNVKRLCTVRLGRKIFPGLPSYGLGKICRHFDIGNDARHRAMGDCAAMAELFSLYILHDRDGHIESSLKQRSSEYALPSHLPKQEIEKIPVKTGVYYFHDRKGKVIYVGKARNLKRRVLSHFVNHKPGPQKQGFMRKISKITFRTCASDLMAHILEAVEIKKYWPEFNRSQKRFEQAYGLFMYEDQRGYLHIRAGKKVKYSRPVYTFNKLTDALNAAQQLRHDFDLCGTRCGFGCDEICGCGRGNENMISVPDYNQRVKKAIGSLYLTENTFVIHDENPDEHESICVLMENGQFYGIGSVAERQASISAYKEKINRYPSNAYLNNLIYDFAAQFPDRTVNF